MTKISRWPIDKNKMSLFLDDFWTAVASFENKREAKKFFNQFLTHTERRMFAKRFQVAMMLVLGYEYKEIKSRVRVTEGTIARISNWLKEEEEEITNIAQRIIRLKEKKMSKYEETRQSVKGKTGGRTILEESASEIVSLIRQKNKEKSLSE